MLESVWAMLEIGYAQILAVKNLKDTVLKKVELSYHAFIEEVAFMY
jgi:hypothetical protein